MASSYYSKLYVSLARELSRAKGRARTIAARERKEIFNARACKARGDYVNAAECYRRAWFARMDLWHALVLTSGLTREMRSIARWL